MTTDHFCFYLQNRLIQTSQTGGQWYSGTYPFSIPWLSHYESKISEIQESEMFEIINNLNSALPVFA